MVTTPVRTALIGAGRIAQAYAEAFNRSSTARLVGVVDISEEAARSLADQVGCPAFSRYEDLDEWVGVEAVLVCTPPASHFEICSHFLTRSIPVMCEKPLCLDLDEAKELVAMAESAEAVLTMASKFRFVDDVERAKRMVDSGTLGEVLLLENTFAAKVDMHGRWNSDPKTSGGGVLIDSGTHSVDIVRHILGPIVSVLAVNPLQLQGLPVEDTVRIMARTEAGRLARIDLSWSLGRETDCYLEIYGSEGSVQLGWKASRSHRHGTPGWETFGHGYDKVAALGRQIDDFAGAVRGLHELMVHGADAVASVAVVQAAYRSLFTGSWASVQEVPATAQPAVIGAFQR